MMDISKIQNVDKKYEENKKVIFNKIEGIFIKNFRTIKEKELYLGSSITLISGKNGTMKSTLLGLIAHPFSSPNDAKDIFGKPLKTAMSEVFRLSLQKDNKDYKYEIIFLDKDNECFRETIRVYPRENQNENRHRVTVGGNSKGKGNFSLNTSYLNLKRLYPIIETNSNPEKNIEITDELETFINNFYKIIIQKDSFKKIEAINDKNIKSTFGPVDSYYDFNTISSGEDNVGHLAYKFYSMEKNKTSKNNLNGIICIDEIEAGLHPVAQKKLINFLIKWSKSNNIQVVATTHSLFMIQYFMEMQNKYNNDDLVLNIISTQYVDEGDYNLIKNPDYDFAYKELTLSDNLNKEPLFKPSIIFEDKIAIHFFKRIVKNTDILKNIDLITGLTNDKNNSGMSYVSIFKLIDNGKKFFSDSIFILDPDVDIKKYENTKNVIKLPSCGNENLCIEKAIVKFIYDLKGSDKFFKHFKKEKSAFIAEFSDNNILNFNYDSLKEAEVKPFKKWAKSDNKFNQYITKYIDYNKDCNDILNFKKLVEDSLNSIYMSKSLPLIKL